MKMPWEDRTGLAKAAAVLASVLTVSLGLCGANYLIAGGGQGSSVAIPLIALTGILELLGIFVGFTGLLIVGLLALTRALRARYFSANDRNGDQ